MILLSMEIYFLTIKGLSTSLIITFHIIIITIALLFVKEFKANSVQYASLAMTTTWDNCLIHNTSFTLSILTISMVEFNPSVTISKDR